MTAQEFTAQGMLAIGEIGGEISNILFINNFKYMAREHFIVRKLDHAYGRNTI